MSLTPADPSEPPELSELLVGTDLVSVDRLSTMLADRPGLADEIFTSTELAYAARHRRGQDQLAARFAAKEAVFKALGTGLARGMSWHDVEVVNGASGRPQLRLSGAAADAANNARVRSMQISLSHTAGLAIAFAAMLCDHDQGHSSHMDSKRGCSRW